jgi:hypothetical protein
MEIYKQKVFLNKNQLVKWLTDISDKYQEQWHGKHFKLYVILLELGYLSIVSDYKLDYWCSNPGRGKGFFPLASVSRSALRPTQPPIQWVLVVRNRGKVTRA